MPAKRINLNIEKGAKYEHKFTWVDENSNPINISSYLARMHIREHIEDTAFVLELTTTNGRITLGGANGEIDLYIGATDTDSLGIQTGVYDLELYDSGDADNVVKLIQGQVNIVQNVTR
jgi:hypothetical protein